MDSTICSHCRLSLRRIIRTRRPSRQQTKSQSTTVPASLTRAQRTQPSPLNTTPPDLAALLSQPTWSVRSLLPPRTSPEQTSIPRQTLHHLLRLSALPLPRTAAEEAQMLATLGSQLHFVRAIQDVDTAGVAPLRAIRDETAVGLREQTVGLAELRDALEAEDVVGHARRPRRRLAQGLLQRQSSLPIMEGGGGGGEVPGRDSTQGPDGSPPRQKRNEEENWDVLGGASEMAGGRYFVVRSGGTGSLPNESVG
ncbi:hypothetical protein F4824DRAFT_309473 [Ustulina deusta]|nr:hypothetical protein F4824DRAFT_309473 [Ustulina deusta]